LKFASQSPLRVILLAALVLRVAVALNFWNVIFPDEIFQALEQAHRLVFGQGVVPWEFQVGLRNWAIPLVLAGPMALARLATPNPIAGLVLIRVLLCVASLGIVWSAVRWGERFAGRRGAWIGGLFTAFWPDLWLMAPHPLEEVLAADLLVPAVYLISTGAARSVAPAALLLGMVFALRLQLAPAVAIAGIVLCRRDPRRWALALAVAAVPVFLAGGLDWFTWGQPFRSFWLNVYLNVFRGVAAQTFGASPAGFFVYILGLDWLWTLPVIILLAYRGGRFLKLPGVLAVVIVLTHSLIAHKEYRFIFPAIALAIPLAGVGLAGLRLRRREAAAAILLIGPCFSPWTDFMLQLRTESTAAFARIADLHPCVVAIGSWEKSFLPLDELFLPATRVTSLDGVGLSGAAAPDVIVTTQDGYAPPAGFALLACYRGTWIPGSAQPRATFCVWRRPVAACSSGPVPPLQFPFPAAARPFIVRDRLTGG
jgi:hypothetical protein